MNNVKTGVSRYNSLNPFSTVYKFVRLESPGKTLQYLAGLAMLILGPLLLFDQGAILQSFGVFLFLIGVSISIGAVVSMVNRPLRHYNEQ